VGGGDDGAHSVAVPLGAAATTASYLCLLWTKRWNKLIKVPAPGGISSTFSNPSKEFKRALTTVCQRAELFCGIGDKLRFSIAPIPEEVDIRKQCSFAEETDPQKSKLHCIGIVYASPQHTTEEQIFSENNASPAFWEFVEWLGERVRLKGWKGYRGDLDVRTDTTGRYSYSARLGEHEVMFHVAPMLPQGKEHLLVRKRRIGNDMTTIVFQDGGSYTPPIESQVLHNYVVVSPILYKGSTFYKISVSRRVSVEKFGPPLVLPSVYEKCETLRVYLLTKLINANFAAMRSPGLASKIAVPAKQKFLVDLINEYYGKK
jgi:hypothetical protein